MAAGILKRPGTMYGPCRDETCKHVDGAETRRIAAARCPIGHEPIGDDRPVFDLRKPRGLVHTLWYVEHEQPAHEEHPP